MVIKMASEVVDASRRMLTIHMPLEEVKEEVKPEEGEGEASPKKNSLVINKPSQVNNNAIASAGTDVSVRIKDEPIDVDETETFEIKCVRRLYGNLDGNCKMHSTPLYLARSFQDRCSTHDQSRASR